MTYSEEQLKELLKAGLHYEEANGYYWLRGTPYLEEEFLNILPEIKQSPLEGWNPGERVVCNDKYFNGKEGKIYAIYEYGVSVKLDDGFYQVYHFNPKHHKQSHIKDLKKIENIITPLQQSKK